MFNETWSTKQDDVNNAAEDEPYIELEMDCQSKDDDTINHHPDEEPQQERREDVHQTGMVNGSTFLKKKILLL